MENTSIDPAPLADCPTCKGTGDFSTFDYGFTSKEDDHRFGRCYDCKATGKVTPDRAERLICGHAATTRRLLAGCGRRTEASRLGISEYQLKRFERGEKVPSYIAEKILAAA